MFSIAVEEVFQITGKKGVVLIGCTSGVIKLWDFLVDKQDYSKTFKVIGIEMVRYLDREKNSTHNPAIMIELGTYEPQTLKGKTLVCMNG